MVNSQKFFAVIAWPRIQIRTLKKLFQLNQSWENQNLKSPEADQTQAPSEQLEKSDDDKYIGE